MPPVRPKPFRLHVPDAALAELKERLARTRWPDEPPLEAWSTGTGLAYMKDLVAYWASGFDWRAQEERLNAFAQFTVPIRGIDLHFIHVQGRGPDPMPLLLSHGWPGSVLEFLNIIALLTESFTVVAPSLPGYTLSFKPGQERFGVEEIADLLAELMSDVLGYRRFGAQGGDWGAFVASRLGYAYPERLTGIHLNMLAVRREPKILAQTAEEGTYLEQLAGWLKEESGYQWIQGTRPQTLAYGLSDSPVGLAAWMVEKFRAWTDCDGAPENAVSRDQMLANISLYWFSGAIGSSFWPYYARMHRPWPIPEGKTVDVPTGYVEFPKEIVRPPRSLAQKTYSDIRRWSVMRRGGHFAAMEQPQALASEIEGFFASLG
ncbi:MAG TPA: epoxide hydrolase [Burkholderiales bacterium]|nr:epoxide hydrolase [Burkholderiales bacterium]